jgi:Lysylphosphatidylglycerol synthase TM region
VARVVETLAAGRWGAYLLLMAPYSLFYFLVDSLVVQQAVSWFNVRVPYRDILPVRATTYILSLINTQLGQGGVAVYLHRRYGIPFWEITGTVVFIMFVEVYQLALYSFVGAAAAGELATGRAPLVAYAVMAGYLVVHVLVLSYARWPALDRIRFFTAFRKARPLHYLKLLLLKTPNLLAAVTVYWLAMPLFDIHVPFATLLTFLPLIFFFAALPIAAAHLGPSQAAWVIFLGHAAPEAKLLAFSLAAHLTFMLMNALIGLAFLRRAARELAPDVPPTAAPAPPRG